MKFNRNAWIMVGASASILGAPGAMADMPIPNDAFGRIEATMSFCAKLDPAAASTYEQQGKLLVREAPAKEIAAARESAEYKEAFESAGVELAKVPKDQAVKTCKSAITGGT
jgi:hypothetical protein